MLGGITITMLIIAIPVRCNSAPDKRQPSASMHCSIDSPPATAGEMAAEGVRVKVFPRNIDMPRDYSGCQSIWDYDKRDDHWQKMSETRFLDGAVTERIEFPLVGAPPEAETYTCHYAAGRLIERSGHCPSFAQANARERSLPAGCLSKLEGSALGSREPCVQELN
jgi:hypothetical protein